MAAARIAQDITREARDIEGPVLVVIAAEHDRVEPVEVLSDNLLPYLASPASACLLPTVARRASGSFRGMINQVINPVSRYLLTGLSVLSLVACAGPSSGATAPANAPASANPPASTTTPPAHPRRFPNTEVTAHLVGYDADGDMVRFQLVRWIAGGPNNGHYQTDPQNSGTHRLPLAAQPTVLSALTLCSTSMTVDDQGNPTQRCTRQQLVQVLSRGTSALAKMHVDGTDHIDRVEEIYQP